MSQGNGISSQGLGWAPGKEIRAHYADTYADGTETVIVDNGPSRSEWRWIKNTRHFKLHSNIVWHPAWAQAHSCCSPCTDLHGALGWGSLARQQHDIPRNRDPPLVCPAAAQAADPGWEDMAGAALGAQWAHENDPPLLETWPAAGDWYIGLHKHRPGIELGKEKGKQQRKARGKNSK